MSMENHTGTPRGAAGNRTRNGQPPSSGPQRSGKKHKRKLKRWSKVLMGLLIAFAICCGIGLGYVAWVLRDLPDWDEQYMANDKTTFLYNTNDEMFVELHYTENRTPVTLSQMPPYLVDCFVGTEDVRFYKHGGVDIKRVFGALLADIKAGSMAQGASTLTMQLARNAILEDQDKKLERKIKEAVLAIQLEHEYSKDEILTMYLNEIYFGAGAYGVQAASQHYFNKDVSEITLSEAAVLTGIIRNPKTYSPILNPDNSLRVRNTVLDNLEDYKPEYKEEVAAAKQEPLVVDEGKVSSNDYNYPWFTDYVVSEAEDILEELGMEGASVYTGGFRIYTTVDSTVQELMEEAYANDDNFPSSKTENKVESGMAVVSVEDSSILGLVGGREHTTKRGLNRATDITRQPGSSYKPVGVFAPAIEAGYSPATVANDAPTTFGSNYKPGNYDGSYSGVVSMREAARKSMNIPAVKFLQMIGTDASIEMAMKMGIPLDEEKDANLAMALGGLTYGVSPLDMAAAYATFGNAGVYTKPHAIKRIEDSMGKVIYEAEPVQTVAMKETTAYLVTNMLETVTQSGTGTAARLSRPVASKTGTVQLPDTPAFKNIRTGNKDAWFAAYTPEMVGVVWMGYDNDLDSDGNPQYLRQIYGGKYPAQIWKKVIGGATKNLPVKQFTRPSGITSVTIDTKSGMLPSSSTPTEFRKSELFDKANAPKETSTVWKTVKICPESGVLATDYCPDAVERQRFTPPKESNKVTGAGADKAWIMPTQTCTIHTKQTAGNTGDTVPVDICTDPSHNGKLVLANVPPDGYTGGCPSKYVKTKYLKLEDVPSEYCGIESHLTLTPIKGGSTGGGTDSSGGTSGGGSDTSSSSKLSAPSGVKAAANTSEEEAYIKVTWSDKNSGSILYEVEYWDTADNKKKSVTTYFKDVTISNVNNGSTYNFRVRAVDDNDSSSTSSWSSTASATVK